MCWFWFNLFTIWFRDYMDKSQLFSCQFFKVSSPAWNTSKIWSSCSCFTLFLPFFVGGSPPQRQAFFFGLSHCILLEWKTVIQYFITIKCLPPSPHHHLGDFPIFTFPLTEAWGPISPSASHEGKQPLGKMPGKNNRAKGLYEKPYSPDFVKLAKGVTAFHANILTPSVSFI